MPDRPSWLPSRRGAFLILFGLVYLVIAKSLADTETTPLVRHVFRFAFTIMPLYGWALLWLVCGVTAVVDGLLTKGRDTLGFIAAVFAPTVWAFVYLMAWIGNSLTPARTLWEQAAVFALIAGAVLLVAGMPDPQPVRQVIEKTVDGSR